MSAPATQVTITEEVTDLSVTNTNAIALDLTTEDVSISINNFAIPVNFMDAANVVFAGHNTISANNVSDALKYFRSNQQKIYLITGSLYLIGKIRNKLL